MNQKNITDTTKQVAVVTGASSGIGASTASLFAAQGMKVVLVARREDRLQALKDQITGNGGSAMVLPLDLTDETNREELITQVHQVYGKIDILVNNAGFGWYGYYSEMPWKTTVEMLQLNITAATHLTHLVLPEMQSRNSGHIINIGSIAGNLPSQGVALYSASKSFLDAFTTALFRELRGSRVHVSLVRAGPVKTEFFNAPKSQQKRKWLPIERWGITSERVARQIWALLKHPKRVVTIPKYLTIVPLIELLFGRLEDALGPLLLKRD